MKDRRFIWGSFWFLVRLEVRLLVERWKGRVGGGEGVIKVFLSSFFGLLIFFSEFYELDVLMMEEEGMVIVGLLVGFNVFDVNFCLKGEDLDF